MQMADYDYIFVKWRALTNLFIYGRLIPKVKDLNREPEDSRQKKTTKLIKNPMKD